MYADQLPKVLHTAPLETKSLGFKRWKQAASLTAARLWLFSTPSGQVVVSVTFDSTLNILDTIDLLEDCYYLDFTIDERPLEDLIRGLLPEFKIDTKEGQSIPPERHQIAFGPKLRRKNCDDLIQRIIYRKDLPYRQEYSSIRYPAELNRRPGNTVAVGPYVSAICGHQNDVENSALLSAVQGVASAARLREIRQAAYDTVASFRYIERASMSIRSRRRTLEDLADKLTDLELELSHSVEATADIGLLVPSLRVENYHTTLFEAMDLTKRAQIAGRMLQRLDKAINAGLTAIQSIERRNDDDRRLRWTVAVGFVSTVAIPVTIVLSYFGMNTREIDETRSMFDASYIGVYVLVAFMIIVGGLSSFILYLQQSRRTNGLEK